jgi:hypothetical protein
MIPVGHTWFSWNATTGKVPCGHTPFSWTTDSFVPATFCSSCHVAKKEEKCSREEAKRCSAEKEVIKKGFLEVKTIPPSDIGSFFSTSVPEAIKRAEELHAHIEEDESKPYEHKYAAREILQVVSRQLAVCKEAAEAQGLSEEWRWANARIDMLLGINFVETDENSSGEKKLVSAIGMSAQYPSSHCVSRKCFVRT